MTQLFMARDVATHGLRNGFVPGCGIALILLLPTIAAAEGGTPVDEIVTTAAPSEDRVSPTSLVLDFEALSEVQPVATADVFRNITGISLRTNSRGNSVVRH